jgi:MYXO-CTERM domain-containing protein
MGATRNRRLGRAISRIPLLLIVALVVVIVGAVPGSPAGAAPKNPPGDPPGNNGTVKIERDGPASLDKGNEPHVDGCIFWLEFYGFDQDQTAAITFTSQAPSTPAGKVLLAETTKISDTPAGGGQDRDYVIAYNLTSAVQGLKEHPKQGYHIKLSSDTQGQPGGAKHKVFWIKCAPAPTTTLRVAKALNGKSDATGFGFSVTCNHRPLDTTFTLDAGKSNDITGVPPGTTCAVEEKDSKHADGISAKEEPADSVPNDGVVTVGTGPAVVTFTNLFPGEGSTPPPDNTDLRPPAGTPTGGGTAGTTGGAGGSTDVAGNTATNPTVLGATETRPDSQAALPRTGNDPRPLTTTGLWALGAGGLALLGGRRRRRS